MTLPIRFLIIEDEPANRQVMIDKFTDGDQTEVLASAQSVNEAFDKIIFHKPNALLLDIKLLGGDAFQLLQKLRDHHICIPPTVIITGHLDFSLAQEALNRFRHEVVHILQKPFLDNWEEKYQRLCTAVQAANPSGTTTSSRSSSKEVIYLRADNATHRIAIADILYLQVGGQGTCVFHLEDSREIRVYKTLIKMLEELPPQVVRVHRKFAIHRDKVNHIDHEDRMLFLKNMKRGIDIGEIYYPRMVELLEN